MTRQDIADILMPIADKSRPSRLTGYVVQSIETGKSNYTVSNLLQYCMDFGVSLVMLDMATEDRFRPSDVRGVHDALCLLMDRYDVDSKTVYRKTGIHYTCPRDGFAPLSIKTLLAVCETIHCELIFTAWKTDESQC